MSFFKDVESAPPIEVFQMTKLCNASTDPNKVNLGVGAYRNDEGKPWVLPVVQTAELQMANDRTLNHEYLPVAGLPDFRVAATRLLLGSDSLAIAENRTEGFQSLGGTGALRLAAAFLKNVLKFDVVYVSKPTWGNHKGVFKGAGFSQIKEYRYWNNEIRDLDFSGMCEDLSNAPANSVIILHAIAHNPTGVDPTKEQWTEICRICKEKRLFVLMDCAYQGFASGNLDDDAMAVRLFADSGMELFVAQSFSKNFGLYNERTGNLIVVSSDSMKMPEIRSQMEIQIRIMWSNPPNHGARIVTTVLNNKAYYDDWKGQIMIMAERIKKMRQELVDNLKKLGTPGNWDHIIKQIGMFSYTGLSEKQCEYMKSKSVFLLSSGRISIAGLTPKNVSYVAKCMDEAVRNYPRLKIQYGVGEPAEKSQLSFVEFAKRKLEETIQCFLTTDVVIDGVLQQEEPPLKQTSVDEDQSTIEFLKVKMQGTISATSSSELTKSPHGSTVPMTEEAVKEGEDADADKEKAESPSSPVTDTKYSTKTEPASTIRTSIRTFQTRSQQTLDVNEVDIEDSRPKAVPARFEGTMLTPVFFEGLMLTPERLDTMLAEAAKKKESMSIPVKFDGGMLTAAFKTLAKTLETGGDQFDPVPVKFQGKLQGMIDFESLGLPVAFDGSMVPRKVKKGK